MKHHIRTTAIGSMIAIALMLFLPACGGKQTVASKSADAFREAQKKGTPIGGEGHGGHSAGGDDHGAMTDSAGDHSTMTGMEHSTATAGSQDGTAGMDHSKMQQGQSTGRNHPTMAGMVQSTTTASSQDGMAAMDHSKMNMGGQDKAAAMQHGNPQQGQQPMAGMDHGRMPGMQHGAGAARSVVMSAPTTSAEMQQLRPEATLRADDFDAPVPISVSEAMKAQGGGDEMSGIAPVAATDHSQHGQTAPATPPRTQSRATATPPQAEPAAATAYACPMHPEVTSDKPGTCPKCGMTLVKKN